MKRGLYVGVGVVLLLVGIVLVALGTVVAVAVGSDDAISTSPSRVRSAGVAVVAENLAVDGGAVPVPDGVGTLSFSATARDGRPMFLGVGSPADVRTYLTGSPYSVVVDLSAGAPATTRTVPGSKQPPAPDGQTFWTQSATGSPARVSARLSPGSAIVVMNADGARVVDADLVVTLHVGHAFAYAWAAAGVGLLLVLLSVLCFWRARVAGRRARSAVAPLGTDTSGTGSTVLPGAVVVPAGDPAAVLPDLAPVLPPEPVEVEAATAWGIDDESVVAAPASAALAALVSEASDESSTDETAEIPVVTEPEPAATSDGDAADGDAADPDEVEDDSAVDDAAEADDADDEAAEVDDSADDDAAVDDTADVDAADPLFDELVSSYGVDPVHDPLPGVTAGEDASAEPAPDAAAPGTTSTDG